MSDFQKNQKKNLDNFWDIARLVPPKPKRHSDWRSSPPQPTPIDIPVSQKKINYEDIATKNDNRLTITENSSPVQESPTIYAEYINFSPLIPRIKVVNWKSSYNYYEFFCRQATALYNKRGTECQEVHFFSYVAQYSQLNRSQLDWYLWWRECVRKGTYLKTDISYIYLLIFEIINLGTAIDTSKSLNILISLWTNYKDTYPQLSGALGDWICDYSMIHNLPIAFPDKRIDRDMLSRTSFLEAFLSFDLSNHATLSKFLLSYCCSYNYRKSKFYTEENRSLYDQHLPAALNYLLETTDLIEIITAQDLKHTSRVAFTGALCSYKTRKHIEIDYIPLCDSHEIKSLIGNTIKYSENKLRTYLGIRSKLGVSLENQEIFKAIDQYFSQVLLSSDKNSDKLPEYEKLYEVKDESFSLASALDIERQSWEVTEKLVDAFEEEIMPEKEVLIESMPTQPDHLIDNDSMIPRFIKAISEHKKFFQHVLDSDTVAQETYIKNHRIMPEAIVDEINNAAVEIFGDILIEETDNGYQIIEEYRTIFE